VLFNHIKGIHQKCKDDEVDENYLKERASKEEREKWNSYEKYFNKQGVLHPKVKYPVLFGKGKNKYPGMIATEDIK